TDPPRAGRGLRREGGGPRVARSDRHDRRPQTPLGPIPLLTRLRGEVLERRGGRAQPRRGGLARRSQQQYGRGGTLAADGPGYGERPCARGRLATGPRRAGLVE